MKTNKENKLDEIFNDGMNLRAELADFYRKIAEYGKISGYDETYEKMREQMLMAIEGLRKTVSATVMA